MAIKRIIMDIDESLHKKLKDYAIKDDRTLNSAIKRVLAAGIDIVDSNYLVSSNSTNVTKDVCVDGGTIDQYADDNVGEGTIDYETHKHGGVLTDDQRRYLNENPGKNLDDIF